MRKQTKLVAVLSAAALLAIGASMTSFAATGWQEEDGTWVYYDKDEYKVTDTWKKSGNYWYYLDEDGYMATSKLVENGDTNNNTYYVDESGRMVANKWVQLENENYYDNSDDDESANVWYYFQNSGKAYKTTGETSFKTINNKKYAFNGDGHMLYGWVSKSDSSRVTGDDAYRTADFYCGTEDDGARVSNDWRKLYISQPGPDTEDDDYWFYFANNGAKVTANDGKKINGKYYAFDEVGVMISEWNRATEATAANLKGYYSDSDNGARKKGWFQAVPSANINSTAHNDDDSKWFYGNNNGTVVTAELKTINGKKYAFNDDGEMLSGVWSLAVDGNAIDMANSFKIDDSKKVDALSNASDVTNSVYYFGTGDDGAMKTGNQNADIDGDTYQFSFGKDGSSKGKGLVGVKSNYLYIQGKKAKADTDYRYQVVSADDGSKPTIATDSANTKPEDRHVFTQATKLEDQLYVVNTSGAIMKSTTATYKDTEGRIYKVYADGQVKQCYWAE